MKNILIFILCTFICVNSMAQLSGNSLGNATCEDFILSENKIYLTGSYQNSVSLNKNDSFSSDSNGSLLLGSIDTLFKNFSPIIKGSKGSFIRGQKITNFKNGYKIVTCLTNGNSEIDKVKFSSNGGWDILLIILDKNDHILEVFQIGSETDESIINQYSEGTQFNLLFKCGNNVRLNGDYINIQINESGYLLYSLDINNSKSTFYKVSDKELLTKKCFIPLSFQVKNTIIKAFGYYDLYSCNASNFKEYGILEGKLGTRFIYNRILSEEGKVTKSIFNNGILVFDITKNTKSLSKSSFYIYTKGKVEKLDNELVSEYHIIQEINVIDSTKLYCLGNYHKFINNSKASLINENGGTFINYFNLKNLDNQLEDIEEYNVVKLVNIGKQIYIGSTYTNINPISSNSYNNFKISKVVKEFDNNYSFFNIENKLSQIKTFPNPVFNSLTIESKLKQGNLKFILINEIGQEIQETIISDYIHPINLDLSKFSNGIYYLKIFQKNSFISMEKIIIER